MAESVASRGWCQSETLPSAIGLVVAVAGHLVSAHVGLSSGCVRICMCNWYAWMGVICLLAFGNLDCSEKDLERGMATRWNHDNAAIFSQSQRWGKWLLVVSQGWMVMMVDQGRWMLGGPEYVQVNCPGNERQTRTSRLLRCSRVDVPAGLWQSAGIWR